MSKKLLLYLNLGTPKSPNVNDVRPYLKEFLSDPFVIDIPKPLRWLLVNAIIAPFRSPKSAEAYSSIWTSEGSPLLVNTKKLIDKMKSVKVSSDWDVAWCMRYGSHNAQEVLSELDLHEYESIYLFPAYPQYALSSTETGLVEVKKTLSKFGYKGEVKELLFYHKENEFLDVVKKMVSSFWDTGKYDYVLFSYHGLPKRHVKKVSTDCFKSDSCCFKETRGNTFCYRHQCVLMTEILAAKLVLKKNQYSFAFQSRLGGGWIEPFTDVVIEDLPKTGVKRLLVVCPSFTADCLETLEEINIRGREAFIQAGGESFDMVPAVNDSEIWANGVWSLAQREELWEKARPV